MSKIPFVDRKPSKAEVERIRLILSTYQDGTGRRTKDGRYVPDWRDFERAVAAVFGGVAQESKAIFDVVLEPAKGQRRPKYGLSCKMRRELNRARRRDGRATIEVSNAAAEFWDALGERGVNKEDFSSKAKHAGCALLEVVTGWHEAVCETKGGNFDISRSSYLVLLWNSDPEYQLFQFPLQLFDPKKLTWSVPKSKKDPKKDSRRLCGHDGEGNVVEWYGTAGGQLKLYPLIKNATWASNTFTLEPLPEGTHSALHKVETYFPKQWAKAK